MRSPVLLDANLAVLFVVGQTQVSYIEKHRTLRAYDATDYNILCRILSEYSAILFLPNVLTETSNLLRQISEPMRTQISRRFFEIIKNTQERYVESQIAAQTEAFLALGLTDSALLFLNARDGVLLTADLDLWVAATKAKLNAVNFNPYRDAYRADFH